MDILTSPTCKLTHLRRTAPFSSRIFHLLSTSRFWTRQENINGQLECCPNLYKDMLRKSLGTPSACWHTRLLYNVNIQSYINHLRLYFSSGNVQGIAASMFNFCSTSNQQTYTEVVLANGGSPASGLLMVVLEDLGPSQASSIIQHGTSQHTHHCALPAVHIADDGNPHFHRIGCALSPDKDIYHLTCQISRTFSSMLWRWLTY